MLLCSSGDSIAFAFPCGGRESSRADLARILFRPPLFTPGSFFGSAPAGIRLHLLSLAGDGKANRGIAQFLNWAMKATLVAFVHNSNPRWSTKKTQGAFGLLCFFGAPAGIRTPDTLLKRQVLCLLSYWGVAGMAGLEPTISESKSGVLPLHYIPLCRTSC